jgi:hypothetical protein
MALTAHTRERLVKGLANAAAGDNCKTVINAGSGTVQQPTKEALCAAVGSHAKGYALATKFSGNTALATNDTWRLAAALGSYTAALDIKNEQAT